MIQRLVDTGRKAPAALRTIVYGGGPMYVDGLKKAMAAFGPVFAQIYGQGESPMTITGLRRADHELAGDEILGSVGYPPVPASRWRCWARTAHAPSRARSARSSVVATW